MARRRSHHRGWGALVVLLGLGAGVGSLAWWMTGGFQSRKPVALTSEFDREPALQRVVAGVEGAKAPEVVVPARPTAPDAAPAAYVLPAPPSTQPSMSRPVFTQDPAKAADDLKSGLAARGRSELLEARDLLNRALHSGLRPELAAQAREALADIANLTIFSKSCLPGDPMVDSYVVMAGNSMGRLSRRYKVSEDLLAELNGISDKRFIREGARLKMIKGPFHAAINKPEHLMHLYLQDVYIKTLRVALGAEGRTPVGRWKVANHQANPGWTDPRSGKRWHPDDPANPIGEYWIGLEGVEGPAVGQFGYGIHGTNEPDTIGQDVSLGCVRLNAEDIELVYKLLMPGESYVTITE